jgi:hypothetical protein
MEVAGYSETLVAIYQAKRRHIQEYCNLLYNCFLIVVCGLSTDLDHVRMNHSLCDVRHGSRLR